MIGKEQRAEVPGRFAMGVGLRRIMNPRIAWIAALPLMTSADKAEKELYPSSVVGTDFDFIQDKDPDTFVALEYKGEGKPEMPDKRDDSAELHKPAHLFKSSYSDGTSVALMISADFKTADEARQEALRYTPRLGKLPTALRQGVRRVVVHKGGEDTTAFSDVGLIVLYSENATKRISTHDLEETVFHESVHAAWDAAHAESPEWLKAQKEDGRFVTAYARKNPDGEDLAESALFAYTLLHHPDRIAKAEAKKIRRAIPARIDYVAKLVPPGKPVHFAVCRVDLTDLDQLSDIVSNALMRGLRRDEKEVREFLDGAEREHEKADDLIQGAAKRFGVDEAELRAQIEEFRHCNCSHGALSDE